MSLKQAIPCQSLNETWIKFMIFRVLYTVVIRLTMNCYMNLVSTYLKCMQ